MNSKHGEFLGVFQYGHKRLKKIEHARTKSTND